MSKVDQEIQMLEDLIQTIKIEDKPLEINKAWCMEHVPSSEKERSKYIVKHVYELRRVDNVTIDTSKVGLDRYDEKTRNAIKAE